MIMLVFHSFDLKMRICPYIIHLCFNVSIHEVYEVQATYVHHPDEPVRRLYRSVYADQNKTKG